MLQEGTSATAHLTPTQEVVVAILRINKQQQQQQKEENYTEASAENPTLSLLGLAFDLRLNVVNIVVLLVAEIQQKQMRRLPAESNKLRTMVTNTLVPIFFISKEQLTRL